MRSTRSSKPLLRHGRRLSLLLLALWLAGCSGAGGPATDGGNDIIPCGGRLDCPGRLGCREGVCGYCLRDRECLVSEFCNPLDQLCQSLFEDDECRLNQDCALGAFCVQGRCKDSSQVTVCGDALDCQAGQRCDPLNLVCVTDLGCDRDEDCAVGEVCNLATSRCQRACTPETQEVVCGFGLVCDEFGRCVECVRDDQCGVGLHCNPDTLRCEGENSCLTNRDCLPGTVCNPQTRQCTQAPPPCLSDSDCPEGTRCDTSSGACISAECRPDALEPNDTPATAASLHAGRLDGLTLCPQDRDWLAVALGRGDRLQVIVDTNLLACERFQIVLFDPAAEQVLQEGSLLLDSTAAADAVYPLRIQTGEDQASYNLLVTITRGIPCDDDEYEPNDSATAARALSPGSLGPLAICPHDEDWFVIERPIDRRLRVTIEYPALAGDLDLDLVAGDGQTLVMRSATAADIETVWVEGGTGTRFFARVWGDDQTANHYLLQIDLLADAASGG